MKTAVEWLESEILEHYSPFDNKLLYEAIHKAKEMEKEQELKEWIETWSLGYNSGWDNCMKKFKQQEKCYNETFKQKEDIECVHMYLDDKHIPRKDSEGREYSIVGRIKRLEESFQKQLSELESYYLTFKQQEQ